MIQDKDDDADSVPAPTDAPEPASVPEPPPCNLPETPETPETLETAGEACCESREEATCHDTVQAIDLTKCDVLEETARAAWTAYSEAVGGKAVSGDPLPTWEELVKDDSKKAVVAAWKAAANAAVTNFFSSVFPRLVCPLTAQKGE